MDAFTGTRRETVTYPTLPSGQEQGHGYPAPGHVIMILREGSGWIADKVRVTTAIAAPAAVTWHPGDWIEYSTDGSSECDSCRLYRLAALAGAWLVWSFVSWPFVLCFLMHAGRRRADRG